MQINPKREIAEMDGIPLHALVGAHKIKDSPATVDPILITATCHEPTCGGQLEKWRGGMVWDNWYCGKHFSAEFNSFMFLNLELAKPWQPRV